MINWENVKTEGIEAINEIVDKGASSTSTIIVGSGNKNISGITNDNWKELCQSYLTNYKMACEKTSTTVDSALITKAETFIG